MARPLIDDAAPPQVASFTAQFPFKEFASAFGIVARGVPQKSPREILLNVRLDLEPGLAVFSATNLEVWIRHRLLLPGYQGPATVVLMDRATLASILRVGGGDTLTLSGFDAGEEGGSKLKVAAGTKSWILNTRDPNGFPACPAPEQVRYHEIDATELGKAIKRVVREPRNEASAEANEGAVQLEGLLTGFTITTVSSRGLAHQKLAATAVGQPPPISPLPLAPEGALRQAASLLTKTSPPVRLGFGHKNHIQIDVGDTTLLARLAEGNFVDWRAFLKRFPKHTGSAEFPAGTLRLALAAAAIAMNADTRRLDVSFLGEPGHPEEGRLEISSDSSKGEAEATDAIPWDGEPVEVTLDPEYLVDLLESLGDACPVRVTLYPGRVPLRLDTEDGFLGLAQLMGD